MGQEQDPPEQDLRERDRREQGGIVRDETATPLSRRYFLGAGSAAAVTALATRPPHVSGKGTAAEDRAAEDATVDSERAMIRQLATAGTLFPVRLPVHGTVTPPRARVHMAHVRTAQHHVRSGALRLADARPPTLSALRAAERAIEAGQLQSARRGARLLIDAGLLGAGHVALLAGVGDLATSAAPDDHDTLLAAATLAVRAVFPAAAHSPAQDRAASWLRLLSSMHTQCTLRPALTARGLR